MKYKTALRNVPLYIRSLERVIQLYDEAADKFIRKVEAGKTRSVETYADLTAARTASRRVKIVD